MNTPPRGNEAVTIYSTPPWGIVHRRPSAGLGTLTPIGRTPEGEAFYRAPERLYSAWLDALVETGIPRPYPVGVTAVQLPGDAAPRQRAFRIREMAGFGYVVLFGEGK